MDEEDEEEDEFSFPTPPSSLQPPLPPLHPADELADVDMDDQSSVAEAHARVSRLMRKLRKKVRGGKQAENEEEVARQLESYAGALKTVSRRMAEKGWLLPSSVPAPEPPAKPPLPEPEPEPEIFRCARCNVTCPDEGSLLLHMAGKRHRNTELRMAKPPLGSSPPKCA